MREYKEYDRPKSARQVSQLVGVRIKRNAMGLTKERACTALFDDNTEMSTDKIQFIYCWPDILEINFQHALFICDRKYTEYIV